MDGNINPIIPDAGVTLKIGISTAKPINSKKPSQNGAVSYTHLTLPTIA